LRASLFLWDVSEPLRELRDDLPSTFLPIKLSLKISLIFISRAWKISVKSFYGWTNLVSNNGHFFKNVENVHMIIL
jgi:hypothetical protein